MASTKAKSATVNGAGKKTKSATPSTTANGTPATTAVDLPSEQTAASAYGSGKPDRAIYDGEQAKIQAEIDALQAKLSAVKEKIALAGGAGKSGPANDRRNVLRAELDSIRGQQSSSKSSRTKIRDQLQALQDGIQKKVKDLQASKAKVPYKTVAEVDERIKQLEKQVESGNLKLADEKRALQEISQCKRSRRTVEGFQAEQDSIEGDRAKADELRKQLDDPEAKAASERYDQIKAELDEIKKESDEAYANRNKLFDERNALQGQLDEAFNKKRESAQRFRDANDLHWNKVNEDRARRAERQRAQRQAEEEARKKERIDQLREDAEIPAFQTQIEDCQTLIDLFTGKTSGASALSTASKAAHSKAELEGVPKLELRKVEEDPGLVARAKKGEEEAYFVGKTKKSKKSGTKPGAISVTRSASSSAESEGRFNLPLPILTALLSLSIPPPTSNADVPRVIENLQTKKSWFAANQARVTAENKARVEAEIRRLGGKIDGQAEVVPSDDLVPPNGGAEEPPEPASTPATAAIPSVAVSSEAVVDQLEAEGNDAE